ncbi:MAG: universal stress protein [Betaproteobacteria bacterium]|nr:universal stress protein [Betaproteobacteria bacterium]
MFKNILVPTDGTKLSTKAIDMALTLARETGASLTIMTAIPPCPVTPAGDGYVLEPLSGEAWIRVMKKNADRILASAAKRAEGKKVDVTLLAVDDSLAHEAVVNIARKRKCDLIVMSSHGRGSLSALFLGSETMKVLSHSKLPVLVCR